MTKQPNAKALQVMADWWFDRFLSPTHDNGARGEGSLSSGLAGSMAGILADRHPVTEEHRAPFRKGLVDAIAASKYGLHSLRCDYGPGGILGEAMESAGIDKSRGPWKHDMYLHGCQIEVAAGYAAPRELICDIEGTESQERWVATWMSEGRGVCYYAYNLFEHHGHIAQMWSYHGKNHPYESRPQALVNGAWCDVAAAA